MGREKWWTLMHLKREDNAIKAKYLYIIIGYLKDMLVERESQLNWHKEEVR